MEWKACLRCRRRGYSAGGVAIVPEAGYGTEGMALVQEASLWLRPWYRKPGCDTGDMTMVRG